jgi:hypothetical protein
MRWMITENIADNESVFVSPLLEGPYRRYWNCPRTFVASNHVLSGFHWSEQQKHAENTKWDCGSQGSHWFNPAQRFRRREMNILRRKLWLMLRVEAWFWCFIYIYKTIRLGSRWLWCWFGVHAYGYSIFKSKYPCMLLNA